MSIGEKVNTTGGRFELIFPSQAFILSSLCAITGFAEAESFYEIAFSKRFSSYFQLAPRLNRRYGNNQGQQKFQAVYCDNANT